MWPGFIQVLENGQEKKEVKTPTNRMCPSMYICPAFFSQMTPPECSQWHEDGDEMVCVKWVRNSPLP